MAKTLLVGIASDVICPWCYIGKRRFERALAMLRGEVELRVSWLPFQLNPDMPPEGMARAEYRRAKFGSVERGRALDARVAQEGAGEGIKFAFDRMQRTPNTMAAHRLIDLAQSQQRGGALVDALFRAYFEAGRDIGAAAVLAEIAAACGVERWPEGANVQRVAELEAGVRDLGISGVPTFIFGRRSGLSGAYPPEQLAAAIRAAAAGSEPESLPIPRLVPDR
ncbi:MAG: DsbA family oxidoreductase [Betaproteobacteria bacterium]|nr:MAG: DsbA family oxidoreductase [Betaproteobacteria bacterium]